MKRNYHFSVVCLVMLCSNQTLGQIPDKTDEQFRIAVLACHRQFEPAPALARYLDLQSDLCLWIGDNVYADAPDDPSFIQTCYDALEAKPAFRQLMDKFDYMVTWDDHDFGLNDAGKEYRFKEESKRIFREFWQLEEAIPVERDGIYYARSFEKGEHTIQVIMLDVRYNRDAPDGSGDVLGETQWQWLEEQLQQPADLRLIVSGFQLLLSKDAGSETWDKFPAARARLFQTIREARAEKVLFLTGDQHYGEVCRLRNALDFDAVELQFAGINQIEEPEFNPLRVAPVIKSKHSVAVIDVQMDRTETDVPHLVFRIMDAMTNQTELLYRVNLDEISLRLDFPEQRFFSEKHRIPLRHLYPALDIRYTVDGRMPTIRSELYGGAIEIAETTTIKARFFDREQRPRSRTFEAKFERLEPLAAVRLSKPVQQGLSYAYYEGNFEDLPDFENLMPKKEGVTENLDPDALAGREDHYALRFQGFVDIPSAGVYEFFTISDDGSRLFIGSREVVDNGGSHSRRRRSGLIALEKGLHPICIEYFEDYSGQSLDVGYIDQRGRRHILSPDRLFH